MNVSRSRNLADAFHRRVEKNPSRTAIMRKQYDSWQMLSWRDVEENIFELALLLKDRGISNGDRVAILARNQPRWAYVDIAALSLGAVVVPIYPTLMSDDVHFILKDSGSKVVFVEDSVQWEKVKGTLGSLPDLEQVFSLSPSPDEKAPFSGDLCTALRDSISSLTEAMQKWRDGASKIERSQLASIVYTSGTTGEPKGVELTHGNFLSACEQSLSMIDVGEEDRSLFFLPPAHVLGRVEQYLGILSGWTTAYCEQLSHFVDDILEVEPSFFVTVPRVFEKIYQTISSRFQSGLPFGGRVFARAQEVAEQYSRKIEKRQSPGLILTQEYRFFDQLIYSKVRKKFGKRFRFAVVGGASMNEPVARFFHACGICILEGYGLTESTGPVSINTPSSYKLGSVGALFYENRIRFAEDGEILLRGPSMFSKYHNNPEETAQSFEEDGYFLTGDVGFVDDQGFLHITDRKKDIIVSSGGKNIAPQKLEALLVKDPLVSQALVVGGEGKVLGALIAVDRKHARNIYRKEKVASQSGSLSMSDWLSSSQFQRMLWEKVKRVNRQLPAFERIKKIAILPREFSVESGELTPSLKVKRYFCEQKFSKLIDTMYAQGRLS